MQFKNFTEQKRICTVNGQECRPNDMAVPCAIEINNTLYMAYNQKDSDHIYMSISELKNGNLIWKNAERCSDFGIMPNTQPVLTSFEYKYYGEDKYKLIMIWIGMGNDGVFIANYDIDNKTWSNQIRLKVSFEHGASSDSGFPLFVREKTSISAVLIKEYIYLTYLDKNKSLIFGYVNINDVLYKSDYLVKIYDINKRNGAGVLDYTTPSITGYYDPEHNSIFLAWAGMGKDGIFYCEISHYSRLEGTHNDPLIVDEQTRTGDFGILESTSPSLAINKKTIFLTWHGYGLYDGFYCATLDLIERRKFAKKSNQLFTNQFKLKDFGSKLSPFVCGFKDGWMVLWHGFNENALYYSYSFFKGGLLIIGSLFWQDDSTDTPGDNVRKNWRDERLNMNDKKFVAAPIRYGRYSNSKYRKNENELYTMVFSGEVDTIDKLGTAWLVPFKKPTVNSKDIIKEIEELSVAEGIFNKSYPYYFKDWGFVSIKMKENFILRKDIENYYVDKFNFEQQQKAFLNRNNSNSKPKIFNKDQYYKFFSVENESKVTIKPDNFELNLNNFYYADNSPNRKKEVVILNEVFNDYDFFITSITAPRHESDIKKLPALKYPSETEIANLVIDDKRKYFKNNRANSISTFQDVNIEIIIYRYP